MYLVRYAAAATRDLTEIANFLDAAAGAAISASNIKKIRRQVLSLKRDAHRYRERPAVSPGCRAILIGSYIVFYRIEGSSVFILRVLHGSRSITPEMFEA